MVMGPPPCSGQPRAYEGAWRCQGFSLLGGGLPARKQERNAMRRTPLLGFSDIV